MLANIRFLSAYRRHGLFEGNDLDIGRREVQTGDWDREADERLRSIGVTNPRPLLLHLLSTGTCQVNLARALDLTTRLEYRP